MQSINTMNTSFEGSPSAVVWRRSTKKPSPIAAWLFGAVTRLDRFGGLYEKARGGGAKEFVERILAGLEVEGQVVRGSMEQIPREGPLLIVANHPFGGIEGLVLLKLLMQVRPDVKIMANQLLEQLAELRANMIFVNPFGGGEATARNVAPLRQCLRWLKQGGALGMFPAGEVAHFDLKAMKVRESGWHPSMALLLRHSRASVLPVFFEGANGPLFQVAGLVSPVLRTALLPREVLSKAGQTIRMRIGKTVPFEKLDSLRNDEEMAHYLRMRVNVLGAECRRRHGIRLPAWPRRRTEAVAEAVQAERMKVEVKRLPEDQKLVSAGDYQVFIAAAGQIPGVLREIGRLREITFREAGEGTGLNLDLDRFDGFYQHLFVWKQETAEVVGAYRLGLTDKIIPQYGLDGLYTRTLFKYGWEFMAALDPAIEIGRSFVRKEYQRKHLPLLLLWKGIGRFVADHPKYHRLFGTVSMSNAYSKTSRDLVASFYAQENGGKSDAKMVRPRVPVRINRELMGDVRAGRCRIPDLEALSDMVSEVEADGKGIPVLMRQYHKLGGRVLACNVDPKFNMAMDAMLEVDLLGADRRLLELYMGERTGEYLAFHAEKPVQQARCA